MRRLHAVPALVAVAVAVAGVASLRVPTSYANDATVLVQPGDTLTSISRAHGVSIEQLASLNRLTDPNWIFAGQRLVVRQGSPAPAGGAPANPAVTTATHTVSSGETLSGIAVRYGTTVQALVTANDLADPRFIVAGQVLTLAPTSAPTVGGRAGWRRVVVLPGENLTAIAVAHDTTISTVVEANGIANASMIFAGTTLLVPGTAPAATSRPTPATSQPRPAATTQPAPAATAAPPPAASSGSTPMPEWMASLTSRRESVRQLIVREAAAFDVPASFALAVAWQESGWQQSVVSSAGAIGVMQLMPDTADWVAEAMLGEAADIHSPEWNVRAGVRLLRHYLDRYDGDRRMVLAAYFQGERAVDQFGIYTESLPYIDSILYHERFFA